MRVSEAKLCERERRLHSRLALLVWVSASQLAFFIVFAALCMVLSRLQQKEVRWTFLLNYCCPLFVYATFVRVSLFLFVKGEPLQLKRI